MPLHRKIAFALLVSIALLASGCGGGSGGSSGGGSTPTITSVAVSCSPGSINTNQTSTCTPTVSGTGNYSSSVTWSVSPTSIGTVSSAGVLTPASVGTATITATSTQDSTKSGNATVTVTAPSTVTSVSVGCSPASILTTQTSTCTATVQGTGSYSSAVTWAASDGAITTSGVFTPAGTGTATITATSTQDTSKSGTATILVGSPTSNEWTWMGGSSTAGAAGVYGTQGIAAISNVPGARSGADSWVDTSGNLWLFGGGADGSIRGAGWNAVFNDLWKFNPASQEWTWMSGSNTPGNFAGVYQAQGVAATANVPSSRFGAVSWIDMSGNLWLFGGDCYASGEGVCNDLWEFNTTTKEWTWMSGSDATYAAGVYGTQGVASSSNVPGARYEAVSWTDNSGTFWLFGGIGLADYVPQYPPDGLLYLNDLWKFTPSTNKWTWVSGSTTGTASGVYGTLGVSSANNVPGGRAGAVSWADSSGNLWLFGGDGLGSTYVPVANSYLNDLWEFNTTTKEWTWVSGSDSTNASGVYGTEGVAAGSNTPASLSGAASWIDASSNLWLFGGWNYYVGPNVTFDDLWQFNTKTQQWTWMSGSGINTADTSGGYGTLGVPAVGNVPGARTGAVSWIDPRGNLWLFGGWGYDSTNTLGDLNDLWRYQP